MFRVEGTFGDTGRVLIAFMKANGKVIGFGAVYNFRSAGSTASLGITYATAGVYNTGNFILFEK